MRNLIEYLCEQMITERFATFTDKEDMLKWSKQAWEIVQASYEYCGGVAGCPDYDSFIEQYVNADEDQLMWKFVRRGDHMTALRIYTRKRGGRKSIIMATDQTEQGKKDMTMMTIEDFKLKDRQSWSEQSGKALGQSLKLGREIVPNYLALELMPDKAAKGQIQLLEDGFFYLRQIAGKWHCKAIVGNTPIGGAISLDDDLIDRIKNLSKEYEKKYEVENSEDSKNQE